MDTNQLAKILSSKQILGNFTYNADRIIIRAANAAALPNSVYFDLKRFKDPINPIKLGC